MNNVNKEYVKITAATAGRARCSHTLLSIRDTLVNAPLVGLTESERDEWDAVTNHVSRLFLRIEERAS